MKMAVPQRAPRIAVLSDSALPRIDGIAYSVESLTAGLTRREMRLLRILPYLHRQRHGGVLEVDIQLFAMESPIDKYPFTFVTARRIRRILSQFRPDIVSVQTLGPIGVAGILAAIGLRVPYVLAWHTDFETYQASYPLSSVYLRWSAARLRRLLTESKSSKGFLTLSSSALLKDLLGRLASNATAVTVPSRKAARQVREYTMKPPIFVMPTGVSRRDLSLPDQSTYTKAQELNWGQRAMLYVGRLSREKDIPFLIDVLDVVLRTHDNAKLILVGPCHDRRLKRHINSAVEKYGDHVLCVGAVPRSRLADIYGSASVFVTASVSDTQSLAVWEARLMGLPVVALDPLFSESFQGDLEIICTRRNVSEFATAVNRLCDLRAKPARQTDLVPPNSDELAAMFIEAAFMSDHHAYYGALFEWDRLAWKAVYPY